MEGEIRSVARALSLLDLLSDKAPVGILAREAASHLGVDPATASRLLATLISHNYASRLPNGRYSLGARSLRLATAWVDRLLQIAGPPMARVAADSGETVHLIQLVGREAVTVARLAGTSRATIDIEIGPSYPLWASAAGRALLDSLPLIVRPHLLPPEPYPTFTSKTVSRWSELAATLETARRDGVYVEDGELDTHLSCYAISLLHAHRDEKLAIAISFHARRSDADRAIIRKALRKEWKEFAEQL